MRQGKFRPLVVSGLAPRWVASRPLSLLAMSVRFIALSLNGAASPPNAGQARSPQQAWQLQQACQQQQAKPFITMSLFTAGGGRCRLMLRSRSAGDTAPCRDQVGQAPPLVVSGLAPRWAAKQPLSLLAMSVRFIALSLNGAASPPNAGQARSPQQAWQQQQACQQQQAKLVITMSLFTTGGGRCRWILRSRSVGAAAPRRDQVGHAPSLVVSGLAPRWAAKQPLSLLAMSVRFIALSLNGAASPPNAGQARSPQQARQQQRACQQQQAKLVITMSLFTTGGGRCRLILRSRSVCATARCRD
jgi:hypothetical protein